MAGEYTVFESEKDSEASPIEKMRGCGFCLCILTMIQRTTEQSAPAALELAPSALSALER